MEINSQQRLFSSGQHSVLWVLSAFPHPVMFSLLHFCSDVFEVVRAIIFG